MSCSTHFPGHFPFPSTEILGWSRAGVAVCARRPALPTPCTFHLAQYRLRCLFSLLPHSRFPGNKKLTPTPTFAPAVFPFSVCGSNGPPQLISCPQATAGVPEVRIHPPSALGFSLTFLPEDSTSMTVSDPPKPQPSPLCHSLLGKSPAVIPKKSKQFGSA